MDNWKIKLAVGGTLVVFIILFIFYRQNSYTNYFNNFTITKAKVVKKISGRHGGFYFNYDVSGVDYQGITVNFSKIRLHREYYLIYSTKNPKYNIVVWEIPVDEKLLKGDIDINDYIGFGKQRIDKAIIIDD